MVQLEKSQEVASMSKTDILSKSLYVKRLINVIKNSLDLPNKPLTTNGRHSDAFVYIISGTCDYHFDDGTKFTANTGDVLYLPYKAVYTMYVRTDRYRFIFCDFEFNFDPLRKPDVYSYENLKNIDSSFVKLYNTYKSSSVSRHTECMSVLYGIYSLIQQNAVKYGIGQGKDTDIELSKRYIDENFSRPELSISHLAERIKISEVYFRKLFKSKYALTPSKYLILTRIENAKKLMKYPFLSLEECALQSGFSSVQYFCRTFKKETGMTPGAFLKYVSKK